MPTTLKEMQTATKLIPPPVGTVFNVWLGILDFANSFGRSDPIEQVFKEIEQAIHKITVEVANLKERIQALQLELARVKNEETRRNLRAAVE
jgi:uncharacterized small protein (DUF1192 family)